MEHISKLIVAEEDTAVRMGSGDLPVLATPRLVALMENAAMKAAEGIVPEGFTTVGGSIDVAHLAPSPVGAEVSATATLTAQEGKRLRFEVEARQGETLIGKGTHVRFIVNREQFMRRLSK